MRITVHELTFAYYDKVVLNNVTFNLASGEFLTIIGPNGSGKTTLVKCLLGLLKVPNETIFLDDVDINKRPRPKIGYVPQKVDFNFEFPISVSELLGAAYGRNKDAFFYELINILDLNEFYHQDVNELSGGQLQRVFIARALLDNPKLLIFDEPTVAVDQENTEIFVRTLKKLKERGVTIIMVTHDVQLAFSLNDYCLKLGKGTDYSWLVQGEQS